MAGSLELEGLSQKIQTGDLLRESKLETKVDPGQPGFSDVLHEAINQVNKDQVEADTAVKEMIAGRNKNIHETLLAVEKADLSLKMLMQVRNKVLDAYREIMRMQV